MATWQVFHNNVMHDFTRYDAALAYFHVTDHAILVLVTWHREKGPDGKYLSREVIESKVPLVVDP